MTQEEIQLLFKDLCARYPYGVNIRKKVSHSYCTEELESITEGQRTGEIYINGYPLKNLRPYLRPMSSMTSEEERELDNLIAAEMFASQDKDPLFQLTRKALFTDFLINTILIIVD